MLEKAMWHKTAKILVYLWTIMQSFLNWYFYLHLFLHFLLFLTHTHFELLWNHLDHELTLTPSPWLAKVEKKLPHLGSVSRNTVIIHTFYPLLSNRNPPSVKYKLKFTWTLYGSPVILRGLSAPVFWGPSWIITILTPARSC